MSTAATPDHAARAAKRAAGGSGIEEQKRSFLRMVSHELRTPLNSILGFSEILATQLYGPLGDERYQEYAEVIRESGVKLLKMVNQLVEMARLDRGDPDLELGPEPLEPMVAEVIASLVAEIDARALRVETTGLAEAVAIADWRALRSALGALITNAAVFSPAGGEIRISGALKDREVEIVVANDGEGVDSAELPRLVRPFEQGENALTRQSHGAGLGLAICDLACRAMSGRLELASAPGQGFRAHVILPRA